MLISLILIIGTAFVSIPICYNPFRFMFAQTVFKTDTISNKHNLIITFTFLSLSWLLSILFP